MAQRQQKDTIHINSITRTTEELARRTQENLHRLESGVREVVTCDLSSFMRKCQEENIKLKEKVAELTDIVGRLMYRMDVQETLVKTEEDAEGNIKKEEVV